jgi:Kdo2-lipid IVA lauroyltransferase/acyltransferase
MKPSTAADLILRTFSALPWSMRKKLFLTLARLVYHLAPRQRIITLHNLVCAFQGKDITEIQSIARGAYCNLGLIAAEYFNLPHLTQENIHKWVVVEGLDHYQHALARGKGILFFSAHFSNWELSATAFALLVKPITVLYRPLDNPVLDEVVRRVREASGNMTLPKEHSMRMMLRTLQQNGVLAIMIDQNMAWYEGTFVPFFGRLACTSDGLVRLALHTGAPVLPGFLIRQRNGTYLLKIYPEVEMVRSGDRHQDVLINTQRCTAVVEEVVRQYPDQWFWMHQRWKTQPCQSTTRGKSQPIKAATHTRSHTDDRVHELRLIPVSDFTARRDSLV